MDSEVSNNSLWLIPVITEDLKKLLFLRSNEGGTHIRTDPREEEQTDRRERKKERKKRVISCHCSC